MPLVSATAPHAKPFERFDGCKLEPDEWTDGDQICVEVCPFEAIKMDKVFELSRRERFDALLQRKSELAKSNTYYHSIHPTEAAQVDANLAAAAAKKKPTPATAPASAPPQPAPPAS